MSPPDGPLEDADRRRLAVLEAHVATIRLYLLNLGMTPAYYDALFQDRLQAIDQRQDQSRPTTIRTTTKNL